MKKYSLEQFLIIAAFAVIYIVWGSTYLANYLAIQTIPPFIMGGSRFFTAGLILFLPSLLMGQGFPSLKEIINAAYLGVLFLAIGVGLVVWSEQFIDTGIVALIIAFQPLLIVLMMWVFWHQKPGWNNMGGTIIGIIGMLLLVTQESLLADQNTIWGIIAIGISIISWSIASLKVSKIELPKSKLQSSGIQMIGGGATLLIAAFILGEFRGFELAQIDQPSFTAWLYLIVFGSLIGFTCFNYLLTKVSPDKVATSNYVNPVIALLLGWSLNNEILSGQSIIAACFLIGGVILINTKRKKAKSSEKVVVPKVEMEVQ